MVKIHFLQKVLKKWSSFRKKNKKKFSITGGGGGGSGPYMEFSIIIFYFFFEPFPNIKKRDYLEDSCLVSKTGKRNSADKWLERRSTFSWYREIPKCLSSIRG